MFLRKRSPYYWFRYYDKFEPEPKYKRKEHNTKIEATAADLQRLTKKKPGQKLELQGTPELWRKVKELKSALADRNFEKNTKSQIIHKKLLLSEGYKEFKALKMVPGIKKGLKKKTLQTYDIAVDHMIKACRNKFIYKYNLNDYVALLNYFEERKITGRKTKKKDGTIQIEFKSMSTNSRSIYTRALSSLWKYFVEKNYARNNIVEPVQGEETDPNPIPLDDMVNIIEYFKFDKVYQHHYWVIYFMLLTGCRPSSALMQLKEDIDFKRKRIIIRNVKTGKAKKKLFYRFPLYNELRKLIEEMGVKEGDKGRLFDMYAVVPENYTWPLSFWKRGIKLLKKAKKIQDEYTLKQIRSTFMSFLINVLKIDIYTVQKLADHADIKVTDKNYVDFKLKNIRQILDDVTLDTFLEEDDF
ncbi:MAG: tyrosine-type recombinase/integrase [Bacteroidota bacterium]